MAKKKKNNGMISFRPNMMWLWSVVFISIIGFALFGQSPKNPVESDWREVDSLIEKGMVSVGIPYPSGRRVFGVR